MPRLTSPEIDEFLGEREHLVRIGTVDEDGTPRVVPAWFIYNHGYILFTPRSASVFLANLRRDPRIALSIDEDEPPYRKVSVQGEAEVLHDLGEDADWRDEYREIARRYITPEQTDAYIESTIDQPRPLIGVPLGGSRVTSWRMPLAGEKPSGIWARRYYLDGTKMAEVADS